MMEDADKTPYHIQTMYISGNKNVNMRGQIPITLVIFKSKAIGKLINGYHDETTARSNLIDEINEIKHVPQFMWQADRSAFNVFLPEYSLGNGAQQGSFYPTVDLDPLTYINPVDLSTIIYKKGGIMYCTDDIDLGKSIKSVSDLLVETNPDIDMITKCVTTTIGMHEDLIKIEDAYEVKVLGLPQ